MNSEKRSDGEYCDLHYFGWMEYKSYEKGIPNASEFLNCIMMREANQKYREIILSVQIQASEA